MVDFNDRRPPAGNLSEALANAAASGQRVSIASSQPRQATGWDHMRRPGESDVDYSNRRLGASQSGYVRQNEEGNYQLFPNSRSTKGREIPQLGTQRISSSRNNKSGQRDVHYDRLLNAAEKGREIFNSPAFLAAGGGEPQAMDDNRPKFDKRAQAKAANEYYSPKDPD